MRRPPVSGPDVQTSASNWTVVGGSTNGERKLSFFWLSAHTLRRARRSNGRNFISRHSHASNVTNWRLADVNIAARGRTDRKSAFFRLFSGFRSGVLEPGRVGTSLNLTAATAVGGSRVAACRSVAPRRSGDDDGPDCFRYGCRVTCVRFGGCCVDGRDASRLRRQILIASLCCRCRRRSVSL